MYAFPSLHSLMITDGQLCCFFCSGFAVLRGNTEQSQHSKICTKKHFKLSNAVDQEFPEATGQHVLCFPVVPMIILVMRI